MSLIAMQASLSSVPKCFACSEQAYLTRLVRRIRAFPSVFLQIDLVLYEFHALGLEQLTLALGARARTDLTLGVDHPLPGDIVGTGSHGSAYPAGRESLVAVELDARG